MSDTAWNLNLPRWPPALEWDVNIGNGLYFKLPNVLHPQLSGTLHSPSHVSRNPGDYHKLSTTVRPSIRSTAVVTMKLDNTHTKLSNKYPSTNCTKKTLRPDALPFCPKTARKRNKPLITHFWHTVVKFSQKLSLWPMVNWNLTF